LASVSGPLGARTLRLVSPALLVMLAMLAVGCGGARTATVHPTTRPSLVTPTPRPKWAHVPTVKQKKFLAALKAIDHPLAAHGEEALAHAVDICFKVYDETPEEDLQAYASTAYGSGTVTVSPATARKIVAATKKWICPNETLHRRWEL
jgi:hypothetical protein